MLWAVEMMVDLPVGDVGAMRSRAGRLGLEWHRLGALGDEVDRRVAAMDYDCNAGRAFRDLIHRRRSEVDGVIGDLRDVQVRILREAARLEAAQHACARLAGLEIQGGIAVDEGVLAAYREAQRLVQDLA
ncbi:MAG: hypothetical protein ABR598_06400 [Candidatus Dormibacteria bacterium]